MARWLGIDFSGNHLMWRAGCTRSNVWIADVRREDGGLVLHDVGQVQRLAGSGDPFDRLAALLAGGGATRPRALTRRSLCRTPSSGVLGVTRPW